MSKLEMGTFHKKNGDFFFNRNNDNVNAVVAQLSPVEIRDCKLVEVFLSSH